MTIRVEIASQDRMVYEGEADVVIIPGVSGEMGILPNHAPLLSTMKIGILNIGQADSNFHYFTLDLDYVANLWGAGF